MESSYCGIDKDGKYKVSTLVLTSTFSLIVFSSPSISTPSLNVEMIDDYQTMITNGIKPSLLVPSF